MHRSGFELILASLALSFAYSIEAQQPKKLPRLGILSARSPGHLDIFDAFHQALRGLGYMEGINIAFEYRFAEDKYDRLPALMAELVSLEPDVIFTHTTPGALAAKKATTTIPIVIGAGGDLVERGIIASYSRPGGNITGLTFVSSDLNNKRLELLKRAVPKTSQVAILVNPANPVWNDYPRNMEAVAKTLGLRLYRVEARDLDELEAAFATMAKTNVNGLSLVTDTVFGANAIGIKIPPEVLQQAGSVIR